MSSPYCTWCGSTAIRDRKCQRCGYDKLQQEGAYMPTSGNYNDDAAEAIHRTLTLEERAQRLREKADELEAQAKLDRQAEADRKRRDQERARDRKLALDTVRAIAKDARAPKGSRLAAAQQLADWSR